MPRTNPEIAASIRALAKARGITVKQTLQDCGINHNFLYDLEHSNASPSVDKITRIAEYFGVSTAKLLDDVTEDLQILLALYAQLSPAAKADLLAYMQKLPRQ